MSLVVWCSASSAPACFSVRRRPARQHRARCRAGARRAAVLRWLDCGPCFGLRGHPWLACLRPWMRCTADTANWTTVSDFLFGAIFFVDMLVTFHVGFIAT